MEDAERMFSTVIVVGIFCVTSKIVGGKVSL